MPPTSQTWPMATEKPISSPSTKNGLKKVCSGHVQAAAIGIVVEDDVALLEVLDTLSPSRRTG